MLATASFRAAIPARVLAAIAGIGVAAAASAGTIDPIYASGFESQPIVAPANTWTYVPFGDAYCGNNSTTGIGVNLSSTGNRVLIFLNGGGACWDAQTCMTLQTAANYNTGYGPNEFASQVPSLNGAPFFDRNSATNPFRDYHLIFVPYCSGDLHFGNTPSINYAGNVRSHRGYTNLSAYLERLRVTFPAASRVVLAGSSAGGFGAALNWSRVQQVFGGIRVDLIDDSGPFMPASVVAPGSTSEQARYTNWNLATTLPAGCSGCATSGIDNIYTYNATALPNSRGALLSTNADATNSSFFQITQPAFTAGLSLMLTNRWDPYPNRRYFIVNGSGHVLLTNLGQSSGGVTLETFLTRMLSDDPLWGNVTP